MSKIRIETSDWLYNAGIVGLCNILEYADANVVKKNNYIEFDEEELEDFGDKYFGYLIDKYGEHLDYNKKKDFLKTFLYKEPTAEDINKIENYINKLSKKYKDDRFINFWDETKFKGGEYKDFIYDFIEYIESDKDIEKLYLMNDAIGFYNTQSKIISYGGILDKFYNVNLLKNGGYEKTFVDACNYEINAKSKKNNFLKCSVCGNEINTKVHDFTWIHSIGADTSKKTSHYWNFKNDLIMCSVCRLVYSCFPMGFTIISDKGMFVNSNCRVSDLLSINRHVIKGENLDNLENKVYQKVFNIIKSEQLNNIYKEIENIQVIKFHSNKANPTYKFNILSRNKIKLLISSANEFSYIQNKTMVDYLDKTTNRVHHINIFQEAINNLYTNKNMFKLIEILFNKLNNADNIKYLDSNIKTIKSIISINDNFMKGSGKMVGYKQIEECQKHGEKLRKAYLMKKADNKVPGISYKLINALKTKNTARFTDTLLHSYMYLGEGVPKIFVEALKDEDKLQTIGYAFLLGLQGENIKNDENKGEEENE